MKLRTIYQLTVSAFTATALLGTAGTAHAQSSVSLYGVVDGSILYTNHTLNTTTGQNQGHQYSFADGSTWGSRFGIQGSEDLGGGMRASFDLESGVSIANGQFANNNGNAFGRQAWVALDGRYGTLKAGLQYSPFYLAVYEMDPRGHSDFGSGLVNYVDNVIVTGLFNSNAVSYTTPEIKGLQIFTMFAPGGAAGDFRSGQQYSAAFLYHVGGFMIDGGLYNGNAGGTDSTQPPGSNYAFVGRTIGVSYQFENSLNLKASYTLYKVSGSLSNSVYSGGASYSIKPSLQTDAGVWYSRDGNDGANHSILVATGLYFWLSKRTDIYGQIGYVDNHGLEHTGLSTENALYGVTGSTVGATVGIRHTF